MYFNEEIEINFEIPAYLRESIDNLINSRKEERLDIDCYADELIADINRAYYSKDITWDEACLLRKKYLWWD